MRSRLAVRFAAFWASLLTVALLCSVASAAPSAVGTITEFSLPVFTGPWGIAAGPDTNLWFTEAAANGIGRITPAGVITEYPIPTAGSRSWGITAGPDGNLWFTEFLGNNIARITTMGIVTEYPIPTPGSEPYGIAPGPDGKLWFTEYFKYKIGALRPSAASPRLLRE
jgi:virginiamycin B lyase